jgi:aspartyl protease family protein
MRLIAIAAGLLMFGGAVHAADISVIGLFPGKAVLVVNGASPKTYSVGSVIGDGVKLVAATDSGATIETNGKRLTIAIGEHVNRSGGGGGGQASVILQANGQGHFVTQGQINGGTVRMLVDTGATMIALPASDARRLGIDYKSGRVGYANTANGTTQVYLVKLDNVKVGDIELTHIDAVIHENGLPIILLGNSFLNRTDMRRDGEQMTLTKRF